MQREAGLARAAGAGERDEPRLAEQPLELGQIAFAPDEGIHLSRKIVGQHFQRTQRRKILAQTGRDELVDVLGRDEIAQPTLAEIAQAHPLRQHEAFLRGPREERLFAVARGQDPRRTVERGAKVIGVPQFGDALVQSRAHAQRTRGFPVLFL